MDMIVHWTLFVSGAHMLKASCRVCFLVTLCVSISKVYQCPFVFMCLRVVQVCIQSFSFRTLSGETLLISSLLSQYDQRATLRSSYFPCRRYLAYFNGRKSKLELHASLCDGWL